MNTVLKMLRRLSYDELLSVSEAVDAELERCMERMEWIPDSARRRANSRRQSYRHDTGSSAPLVRFTGLRRAPGRRLAA